MRRKRRESLAFFVSMGIHGTAVLWGSLSLGAGFELPELDLEFTEVEFIDPDMLQGDTKEPPPPEPVAVPPPAAADTKEGEGDGPEPKAEEEPEEKPSNFGKRNSKVDQLAPKNSTFSMLLATKKVRGLPFAQQGIDIMAPLPDFQLIIQDGGFDVLHDFNYLVVASPDIRDITQTFLAVESTLPQSELEAGINRSVKVHEQVIEWVERDGRRMGNPRPSDESRPDIDPRWFVFLDDGVAIYVREEFLPNVLTGPDGSGARTSGNYVANLAKLRRFAGREPRAGMQLVMKDLHAALRRAPKLPFPFPDGLEIMSEASQDPELAIKLRFLTGADARAAEKFWRVDLAKMIDRQLSLKLMAKWLYDLMEPERKGKQLVLRGRFTAEQAEQVLDLLAGFSQKMLKRTPEEMEAARKRREENWKRRRGGKLPPSVLDEPDGPKPSGEVPMPTDDEPEKKDPPDAPKPPADEAPAAPPPEDPPPAIVPAAGSDRPPSG